MELLSAPQYNSMVQCLLVVVKQFVKQCHTRAEPVFFTMFRNLQIPLFNIIHLPTHTLDKNLPLTSDKQNSTQFIFFTVSPL